MDRIKLYQRRKRGLGLIETRLRTGLARDTWTLTNPFDARQIALCLSGA
ncbi:MAG TPA: hypothetical protein VKN37_01055 [Roseovarius sp.]|nr:hypothetical protein [Roseovarius sp.]